MKGYRILDEVSISELLTMRNEQGMTNQEIAEALDVSRSSIYRLIGGGGPRRAVIRKTSTPSLMHPEKEDIPACLKVEAAPINLAGAYGHYTVDEERASLYVLGRADDHDLAGYIPLDQLSTFIRELQAIERNIGNAQPKLEVW
jgi:transcriptional regulator with XRE-family HTH domain